MFYRVITGNLIGKAIEKDGNDSSIALSSSQHPFNRELYRSNNKNSKGIWPVTPQNMIGVGVNFVGQDGMIPVAQEKLQNLASFLGGDDLVKLKS